MASTKPCLAAVQASETHSMPIICMHQQRHGIHFIARNGTRGTAQDRKVETERQRAGGARRDDAEEEEETHACLWGVAVWPPAPLLSSSSRPGGRPSQRASETQTEKGEGGRGKITAARDPRIGGPLPSPSGHHAPPSHRSSASRPHHAGAGAGARGRDPEERPPPPRQIWPRPQPPCPSLPRSA